MRRASLAVTLSTLAALALSGCGSAASPASSAPTEDDSPTAAAACSYVANAGAVRDVEAPASTPSVSGPVTATVKTTVGDLKMEMDADRTPCTVSSFVSLAEQGYYDGSDCHRLTTSGLFVLQCGDPSATGRGGPGYSYADELDGTETYPAGTVAMANAGPDTNGSQFFLVYEDTSLPPAYTVFGTLSDEALAIVRDAAAAGVVGGGRDGTPATPVTITSVAIG